jgi:hypothetical protein
LAGYQSTDLARINPAYTPEMQERLANDPVYMQKHRKGILDEFNGLFHKDFTRKGSQVGLDFKEMLTKLTEEKLGATRH